MSTDMHLVKGTADRFLGAVMPWIPETREGHYLSLYLRDSGIDLGVNIVDPSFDKKREAYVNLIIRIAKFQSDEFRQNPTLGIELRNAFTAFSAVTGAKNKDEAFKILNTMTEDLSLSQQPYDPRPGGFFALPEVVQNIKTYVSSPEFDQYTNFQFSESLCRELAYEYAKRADTSDFTVATGRNAGRHFTVEKFSTDPDVALHAPPASERARGMIVMPEEGTELEDKEAVPLWFTWTGTNSMQSALADVAEINAGEHSYRLLEVHFMRESLAAIEKAKKRFPNRQIELNFTGHSLGGALSQLHFCSMQRVIAKMVALQSADVKIKNSFNKSDKAYIQALKDQGSTAGVDTAELQQIVQTQGIDAGIVVKDISAITLNPWNSTGIIEAAASYAKKLIDSNQQNSIPSKGNYVIFKGDLVQQTGPRNAMDEPFKQDITTLVIDNRRGLISNPFLPVMTILNKSIEALPAHTGRLSQKDPVTGTSLKTGQSYRVLRSEEHVKAVRIHLGDQSPKYRKGDAESIRMHLHDNKSGLIEKAKVLQPLTFSRIDKGSVAHFVSVMGRDDLNLNKKVVALKMFVEHQTNPPIKKLSRDDQRKILLALLIASPRLLEKMDQLFLDTKNKKGIDIDALFDQDDLKTMQADMKRLKLPFSFLFDRILSKDVEAEKRTPPKNK